MREISFCLAVWLIAGCSQQNPPAAATPAAATTVRLRPGPNTQEETLEALITAKPGTIIEFAPGTFEYTASLSLTVAGVTLRGAGMDQTILSFKNQNQGKEGLLVTADRFHIENLTIEDTRGDGLKINGAADVVLRRVRARWNGPPRETNGGYGLYPVQCKRVLMEECEAEGASDSGLYIGQSQDVIVRKNKAQRNVAGIEIENSINVDVSENTATNNTGGILVFDLPGLQVKNGRRVRVFNNTVTGNNHPNFAPKGTTVAMVPPGTGLMVMATDQVEFFGNQVRDNQTIGLGITSYQLTQQPLQDKDYDPFPEGIYVHDNTFANNGANPSGMMGSLLAVIVGKPLPDIVYDGFVDAKKPAQTLDKRGIRLKNNGSAKFANFKYDGGDLLKFSLTKPKMDYDLNAYEGAYESWPAVVLQGATR